MTKLVACANCQRNFTFRSSKRFCSDRCRYQAWISGRLDDGTIPACVYCGMPAESIDHIPPQSVRPYLRDQGITRWPFIEADSCRECNCALGARALWTIRERKEWIKGHLRRKYRAVLATPDWADGELKELGPNLSTVVLQGHVIKYAVKKRLEW